MYVVHLSGAENRIFCADHTNIMAADDLQSSRKTFLATSPVGQVTDQAY